MNGTEIAPQFQGRNSDSARVFSLVSKVFSTVSNPAFRRKERDFSRDGPLSPQLLTTLLLYMVADGNRRGYVHLLDGFWDEARSYGLSLPTEEPIAAASFCTARHKITSDLLRRLVHEVAGSFDKSFGKSLRWHGRRVFAIDGTKINLQRSPDLNAAFGVPNDAYCPQVLLSVLLDVCGKVPVDLEIAPFASSERDHLLAMLPRLKPRDVVVLDRGYPSHEVLQALTEAKVDFLIRVPSSHTFAAIDYARESPGDDYRVIIDPPAGSPGGWCPLRLRVVRLTNPCGEETFFLTSLRRSHFSRALLRQLYHMRWDAEEFYKLAKGPYIGQGQFRSKTPAGVRQEMHALVLFLAVARFLLAAATRATKGDYLESSQKAAVLGTADYITRLFLADDQDFALRELLALLQRIARRRDKRRPNRSFPRVSYKPSPRWGPNGRRGG